MSFGGWAIEQECFDYIRQILPEGSTVLELGSGGGTEELSKYYKVISIEQDINYIGKYNSTYIHAPLKQYEGIPYPWFDVDVLKRELPKHFYDIILVDAPVAGMQRPTARHGFHYFIDLFNTDNIPIVFDDVNRDGDYENMLITANVLGREFEVHKYNKWFGVILP